MARRRKFQQSDEPVVEETEAESATAPEKNVRMIGGMVETKWSGIPMYKCPRCRGTTFKASEAKIHVCKVPKMADEAEE